MRRTARGTLCWQHGSIKKGLRIKKSGVPGAGLGLFTTREFQKDEHIDTYRGDKLKQDELDRRYPGDTTAEYVVQVGKKKRYIDGRKTDSSYARWANHKRKRNNADFGSTKRRVKLEATKKIPANTEIFTRYYNENTPKQKRYRVA